MQSLGEDGRSKSLESSFRKGPKEPKKATGIGKILRIPKSFPIVLQCL
jgi:hypothetical protein